jgi:hypothetical protein
MLLIALGIVLLLQTTGVISWRVWPYLWRLWPVIIVAIGLNWLLGRRAPWLAGLLVGVLLLGALGVAFALAARGQGTVVTTLTEPLADLRTLDARVSFGPGDLAVKALPVGSPNVAEGRFETSGQAARATLRRSGDSGELRLEPTSRMWFGSAPNAKWDLALARAPRLTLKLNVGAANVSLDLRELQVSDLELDAGAAHINVTLPAGASRTTVKIKAGAADISLAVPEGVAARITHGSGLSSVDVDTSRFPRTNGSYASPGFEGAANRVSIDLRLGAASVKVR